MSRDSNIDIDNVKTPASRSIGNDDDEDRYIDDFEVA